MLNWSLFGPGRDLVAGLFGLVLTLAALFVSDETDLPWQALSRWSKIIHTGGFTLVGLFFLLLLKGGLCMVTLNEDTSRPLLHGFLEWAPFGGHWYQLIEGGLGLMLFGQMIPVFPDRMSDMDRREKVTYSFIMSGFILSLLLTFKEMLCLMP